MTLQSFRFHVGTFACAVFADGTGPLSEADISRIFTKDVDRVLADFRTLPEPPTTGINILYVENAGKRFLIDSGNGFLDKEEPSQLRELLRAEGIPPESIDMIIITHFHGDHIGGLLDGEGRRVFPKARLVVPTPEYAHWMAEEHLATLDAERAELLRKTFGSYSQAGGVTHIDGLKDGKDIAPGICYVPAYGHTPGHSGVWLESEGEQLLHIADTAHMSLQLNLTDVVPKFDVQPDVAIATRRATFERAESENLLIMAYHFPFPGVGRIQRTGGRRVWVPYLPTE